jgi:thioester reductase-like protein
VGTASVEPVATNCADVPDWRGDAVLPSDIVPGVPAAGNTVLLTGATGFLGSHLLRRFLAREAGEVYCLARSGRDGSACDRVELALREAGALSEGAIRRLHVFDADLGQSRLGLDESLYAALAGSVSSIVHCAADVSWSRSYSKMRASNVLPIVQLLRLACHGPAKHFALISSLAVCYSTDLQRHVAESSDPTDYLHTIPLGYAQTKAIAERLVRQAEERGLETTIVRPALITADSAGMRTNAENFVSWLLSGCIRMGYAPDVDWQLDVVPVDFAAQAIAANLERRGDLHTLHIAHPQPRQWRELVLFLNFYGYNVRLEPFSAWRKRLTNFPDASLPLRRFIPFFTKHAQGSAGLSVSQVYEAGGQPRISNASSEAHLASLGLVYPELGAHYFACFLAQLRRSGGLQSPAREPPSQYRRASLECAALGALRPFDPAWRPARFEARGSIVTELASWRFGGHIGLFGVASSHGHAGHADLILKIKARDEEVITTAIEVASIARPRLGPLFERFRDQMQFDGADERETALYAAAHPHLQKLIPHCHAVGRESGSGRAMLLLERLENVELLDSVNQPQRWTDEHLKTAVRDLASIHALAYGRTTLAESITFGVRPLTSERIVEAIPLWQALHEFGEPFYRQCGGQALAERVALLVANIATWVPAYARETQALIHNDCNPRNMAFRRTAAGLRTCLYDWELCTLAAPQRDLAELLCFTLEPAGAANRVAYYVDLHRHEISCNTGHPIDSRRWMEGFRLALGEFMLRRLSMYTMLHSCVRQPFLPRVMRTWMAIEQAIPC